MSLAKLAGSEVDVGTIIQIGTMISGIRTQRRIEEAEEIPRTEERIKEKKKKCGPRVVGEKIEFFIFLNLKKFPPFFSGYYK